MLCPVSAGTFLGLMMNIPGIEPQFIFTASRTLDDGTFESQTVPASSVDDANEVAQFRSKHKSDKLFTVEQKK